MIAIEVIVPEGLQLSTEAEEVVIPTQAGGIGVRHGHIPLVAPLKAGAILFKGTTLPNLAVESGIVEVTPEKVRLLLDSAPHAVDRLIKERELAITRADAMIPAMTRPTTSMPATPGKGLLRFARKRKAPPLGTPPTPPA